MKSAYRGWLAGNVPHARLMMRDGEGRLGIHDHLGEMLAAPTEPGPLPGPAPAGQPGWPVPAGWPVSASLPPEPAAGPDRHNCHGVLIPGGTGAR